MISEELKQFPEAVLLEESGMLGGGKFDRGELTLEVAPENILPACERLRTQGYDLLSSITATDWYPTEPRFRVMYHLFSIASKKRVRLATRLLGDNPRINSLIPVWPNANWYEREVYDLFGVHFTGHPDLRRIVLPDDWEGHPLRKDYPTTGIR